LHQETIGVSAGKGRLMPRIHVLLAALTALNLAGCAGMSEQECAATDWRSVGFEDGAAGRAETAIGGYRQACAQHGVTPDLDRYRLGHAEGVEVYCRPGRGFDVGRHGGRYQGVCPAAVESEFLAAFADGRQLYVLESDLRSIDGQIAARQRRLDAIDKELAAAAAEIITDGTSAERRTELLLTTKSLADEESRIESELQSLGIERALADDELTAYESTLAQGR
jgi:hypothetical protein